MEDDPLLGGRLEDGTHVESHDESLANDTPGSPRPYETNCWGCGLRVSLPRYSPSFKCGWCGAITKDRDFAEREKRRRKVQRWVGCMKFRDRCMVSCVILLIFAIIFGGVWAVFPILFTGFSFSLLLHLALTLVLSYNTVFNYAAASIRSAGDPPFKPFGSIDEVGRGQLEDHAFCDWCRKPKPRQAHHCRACRACVLDMDHHCPFIGNCVGAGNHRHFLLFLVWAQLSGVYMLAMGLWAATFLWPTLVQLRDDHLHQAAANALTSGTSMFFEIIQLVVTSQIDLTLRAIGVAYIIIAAVSLLFGVGILFIQQIRLVASGHTYIDQIQMGLTPSGAPILKGVAVPQSRMEALMENLRRLFGKGPVLLWLLPRLAPPPGTLAHKLHDKFP